MQDPDTLVYFEAAPMNRDDMEDMIDHWKTSESNAKFIWTQNVGVYGIDSVGDDFYRRLAIREFETILSQLFQKKVKISIAD